MMVTAIGCSGAVAIPESVWIIDSTSLACVVVLDAKVVETSLIPFAGHHYLGLKIVPPIKIYNAKYVGTGIHQQSENNKPLVIAKDVPVVLEPELVKKCVQTGNGKENNISRQTSELVFLLPQHHLGVKVVMLVVWQMKRFPNALKFSFSSSL